MKGKPHHIKGVNILHEDPDVIVVEKAAGVLSCATRRGGEHTVEDALNDYVRKGQLRSRRQVYLVHRLDRETSGVMMVAKTPEVQEYFRSNWNELTEKTYLARVHGTLEEKEGLIESYLAEDQKTLLVRSVKNPKYGKLARTLYKVLSDREIMRYYPQTFDEERVRGNCRILCRRLFYHVRGQRQVAVLLSQGGY